MILAVLPGLARAADPADRNPVIAQVGDQTLTKSDFARAITSIDPETLKKAASDRGALLQLAQAELGRRAVLAQARLKHWDRRPEIAARAQRAAEDVIITSFLDAAAVPPPSFPSDNLIRQVYRANLSHFMQPRQYHVAQIYIARPAPATSAAVAVAEQHADALAEAASEPDADFAVLAEKNSADSDTARRGGDLGWVSETVMIPEIAKALSGLSEGEVSSPVAVMDGWHIMRMLGTKAPAPAPLDSVRATIISMLRQQETARLERAYVTDLLARGHAEADLDRIRDVLAQRPR